MEPGARLEARFNKETCLPPTRAPIGLADRVMRGLSEDPSQPASEPGRSCVETSDDVIPTCFYVRLRCCGKLFFQRV